MDVAGLSAIARTRVRRPPSEVLAAFASAQEMSEFWFTRRGAGMEVAKSVEWFVGSHKIAFAFDEKVKQVCEPIGIVIEWVGLDGRLQSSNHRCQSMGRAWRLAECGCGSRLGQIWPLVAVS